MTTTRECIFCTMARDSTHPDVIYRDERAFAVRDINPKAPVHVLVVPQGPEGNRPSPHPPARRPQAGRHGLATRGRRLQVRPGRLAERLQVRVESLPDGLRAHVGPGVGGPVPIMGHLFVVAEEMARREGVTLSGYRLAEEDLNQEFLSREAAGRPAPRAGTPVKHRDLNAMCRKSCNEFEGHPAHPPARRPQAGRHGLGPVAAAGHFRSKSAPADWLERLQVRVESLPERFVCEQYLTQLGPTSTTCGRRDVPLQPSCRGPPQHRPRAGRDPLGPLLEPTSSVCRAAWGRLNSNAAAPIPIYLPGQFASTTNTRICASL